MKTFHIFLLRCASHNNRSMMEFVLQVTNGTRRCVSTKPRPRHEGAEAAHVGEFSGVCVCVCVCACVLVFSRAQLQQHQHQQQEEDLEQSREERREKHQMCEKT